MSTNVAHFIFFFFFQAEDGIRDYKVTGVQTCALPIWAARAARPDQPAAAKRVVYDKAVALARDAPHVVLLERRARALQQPGVEFEAADGVLHARDRNLQPSEVHPPAPEGPQAVRISLPGHNPLAQH